MRDGSVADSFLEQVLDKILLGELGLGPHREAAGFSIYFRNFGCFTWGWEPEMLMSPPCAGMTF